jgi:hypothetical protein
MTALKQEEIRLRNLVNIVRPVDLPELCPPEKTDRSMNLSVTCKKALPVIGTRRKPANKKKQVSSCIYYILQLFPNPVLS